MKFDLKSVDKKWKEYALAGCVCILFFVCITNLGKIWSVAAGIFKVIKPVFLGFLIAYIINPVAVFFNKRLFKSVKKEKTGWSLSVIMALIIVLAILVTLVASLIPQIVDNLSSLAENYTVYVKHLVDFLRNIGEPFGNMTIIHSLIDFLSEDGGLINTIGKFFADNVSGIVEKTTSIGSAAMNWLIGGIFAVYFLMAKSSIAAELSRAFSLLLSPVKFERLSILLGKFNTIFSKYIICELLDSIIVGGTNYLFMLILSMPDALFVSVAIGLTNLAPTFGPIAGAVIGVFVLLLIKPSAVLPFIIFTLVLQTLDGYIIKPKLFGDALNVPGVIILISIIVFGKLMGVPGMLIAIPAAAILVYIYSEAFIPWLELKKDLKQFGREQGDS